MHSFWVQVKEAELLRQNSSPVNAGGQGQECMPNHTLPSLPCVVSTNTPKARTSAQHQQGREDHSKDALWENEELQLAHPIASVTSTGLPLRPLSLSPLVFACSPPYPPLLPKGNVSSA